MSYHRPIRITVEDAELINEMPSNSTTPSTSTQNTEDTQNTENTFDSAKSSYFDSLSNSSSSSMYGSNFTLDRRISPRINQIVGERIHSAPLRSQRLDSRTNQNISPLSVYSYSPERRIPVANRIRNIVTNVVPYLNTDDNLSLPTIISETDESFESEENMKRCTTHCCFINVINIFLFVLFSLIDGRKASVRNPEDISWIFYAISPYPECKDTRQEIWKLISHSFVHGNLTHLLGNTLGLMVSGSNLNRLQTFKEICLVYFICVINGALSFYVTNPYDGLLGASGGVYGMAGSNIASFIYNYDSMYPEEVFYFIFFKSVFLLLDFVNFVLMYNKNIAYQTHWYCYLFGILSGLMIYDYRKKKKYKKYCCFLGIFLFCYLNGMLIYNYTFDYPREYSFNYFKITKEHNCCYDFLHFQSVDNATFICNISQNNMLIK